MRRRVQAWPELFTGAILVVAVVTLGLRAQGRPAVAHAALFHIELLAGYLALAGGLAFFAPRRAWAGAIRGIAVVVVMFTLYTSLGLGGFEVMPWTGDAWLAAADHALFFGHNPHLWVDAHVTFARLEFFSFIYGLFIPILYMSIFLGIVGRPDEEREEFFAGFALLYACAFLGYLFLPSRGPVEFYAGVYPAALHGGTFHNLILHAVAQTGGNLGAFPSLHVGATAYTVLFDARHNRLRAWTYLPVLLLIAAATLVLRYHYVVDLLAGAALAWGAARVAPRLIARSSPRPVAPSAAGALPA